MKAALIVLVAIVGLSMPLVYAKTFNRCTLALELLKLGVPRSDLARWTCIAENESKYRTNAVGKPNSNGSRDYGIFQINDKLWCQPKNGKSSANICKISCDALLTDDIRASVSCARMVQRQQGWTAWSVWKNCNGVLPSIDVCLKV